jgi:CYTH domain-containing protein
MGVEIERKFKVKELPSDLENYKYHVIEQGYLNITPAIRVRREDDNYYMTYKSKKAPVDSNDDHIGQTEYNLPLDQESYEHLIKKADGNVIRKKRYLIPIENDLTIELDVFGAPFEGTVIAEVEFPSEEAAKAYKPADWFGEDVTGDIRYSNAHMSGQNL